MYGRRLTRLAHYGTSIPSRAAWSMGMLTVTAPGTSPEHRRFVPPSLYRPGMRRPVCGCENVLTDRGVPAWNVTTAKRWNHLRTLLAREYPGLKFCKGTEVQKRGALHLHAIITSPDPIDVTVVQALALRAGFGCSVDWAPFEPGSRRAAYYVAKYVTKDAEPGDVPWDEDVDQVDTETGEITTRQVRRAHFRPWSASHGWGVTLKQLRLEALAARNAAAAARAATATPEATGTLIAGGRVGAVFPGPIDSG